MYLCIGLYKRVLSVDRAYSFLCDAGEQSQYPDIFHHVGVDVELTRSTTVSDTVPVNCGRSREQQD